jgi:hypothetical protein
MRLSCVCVCVCVCVYAVRGALHLSIVVLFACFSLVVSPLVAPLGSTPSKIAS